MAKQSGLGSRFLTGGYDISGDVQALDSIAATTGMQDGTDVTQYGHARIPLARDGSMGFTVFFDTANAHPVLSALPTADQQMMALLPVLAVGSPAAVLNAKQIGYDATRGTDGSLTLKVAGLGNAYGLEWGKQVTPGVRADTTATNGTSLDNAAATAWGAQMYLQVTAFTGTSVTVTVQQSADNSTWITLGSAFTAVTSAPATQRLTTAAALAFTATNASPCVFTVTGSAPANGTVYTLSGTVPTGFTAGTVYYVVSSSGSTFELSATSGGSAINSSSTGTGTATPAVLRYLRAISAGTFTVASFAVVVNRNLAATVF